MHCRSVDPFTCVFKFLATRCDIIDGVLKKKRALTGAQAEAPTIELHMHCQNVVFQL